MSSEHKAALAKGREQGRTVRAYLEALESNRPRRGRKRTVETVERQLAEAERRQAGATALDRVLLTQQVMDLRSELSNLRSGGRANLAELEDRFAKVAKDYSRSKGISYAAWREAGVDAGVLRRAGIGRAD